MSKTPLVTAVMLTGKDPSREAYCQMAVRCFKAQTWPNKELVIVNHGDWVVNTEEDPEIREYRIGRMSMGLMRQAMLDHAEGEVVIQWDDDDISMPARMAVQATPIIEGKVEATFLGSQTRYSMLTNCALVGWNKQNPGIDGTICHRRRPKYKYKDVKSREDSIFRKHFDGAQLIIQGDRLHIRLHHGGNIMGEGFIMYDLTKKRNIWRLDTSHERLLANALTKYLHIGVPPRGHRRVSPYILPKQLIGQRIF